VLPAQERLFTMKNDTPSTSRAIRHAVPPLPHPSWQTDAPLHKKAEKKALTASEFWERLGI